MSEVNRLRDEARKRRAAATAKAARIRRSTGANVAGTEFDPRRPHGDVSKMNSASLRKYIRELNSFVDRGVQFTAGDRGAPLPRGSWNSFERKQAKLRQMNQENQRVLGQFQAFGTEESVSDVKDRRYKNRGQGGRRGAFNDTDYRPGEITNAKALNELEAHLDKMFSPKFMSQRRSNYRHGVMEAFKIMGELQLMEEFAQLSDFQFDVLWNDPRFAEVVFAKYDAEQARTQGNRKEQAQDRAANEQFELAGDFLKWARTEVPQQRPAAKPEATERIKGFRR